MHWCLVNTASQEAGRRYIDFAAVLERVSGGDLEMLYRFRLRRRQSSEWLEGGAQALAGQQSIPGCLAKPQNDANTVPLITDPESCVSLVVVRIAYGTVGAKEMIWHATEFPAQ